MIGRHLLADLWEIDAAHLRDAALLRSCLLEAARVCKLTPVAQPVMHEFPGGGVTGFLLLSESHLSLHSYPEKGYLALDLFTCGDSDPRDGLAVFRARLAPQRENISVQPRGETGQPASKEAP